MIDRLREQIQHRLDQLTGEADRLRKALAALDPRSSPQPAREAPAAKTPTQKRAQATKPKPEVPAANSAPARRTRRPATRSLAGRRPARPRPPCWRRSPVATR